MSRRRRTGRRGGEDRAAAGPLPDVSGREAETGNSGQVAGPAAVTPAEAPAASAVPVPTRAPALDWAGLMRAGLRGLGLTPDQFWGLTPAELALMLGIEFGAGAMTRHRLDDLIRRFPDHDAGAAAP